MCLLFRARQVPGSSRPVISVHQPFIFLSYIDLFQMNFEELTRSLCFRFRHWTEGTTAAPCSPVPGTTTISQVAKGASTLILPDNGDDNW